MVSRVFSAGLSGINGYIVTVECLLSGGLPRLDVVGLPTGAVSEAGERVRAAANELKRKLVSGAAMAQTVTASAAALLVTRNVSAASAHATAYMIRLRFIGLVRLSPRFAAALR